MVYTTENYGVMVDMVYITENIVWYGNGGGKTEFMRCSCYAFLFITCSVHAMQGKSKAMAYYVLCSGLTSWSITDEFLLACLLLYVLSTRIAVLGKVVCRFLMHMCMDSVCILIRE